MLAAVLHRRPTLLLRRRASRAFSARRTPDYDSFLTPTSRRRRPSAIRALQPLLATPGMISLGGGMPNPATFPFSHLRVGLAGDGAGAEELNIDGDELTAALQYSASTGLPPLTERLINMQRAEHAPPAAAYGADGGGLKVHVATGSQDILVKAFEMLLTPESALLVEEPTYSGSLAFLQPYGPRLVGVATDGGGLVPASLRAALEREGRTAPGRPRVLYTIPVGANPTGGSLSLERKREIYALAREYDLLLLEDDPYYFLQFGDGPRTPSLLSMDEDGRVLRFDSLSKLLSSGLRVGYATGPAALVDRLELHTQATSLHTSGVSQALVLALLKHWGAGDAAHGDGGLGGFDAHVRGVARFYEAQCEAFLAAADTHLTGLAEWTAPSAGMFSWIKLLNGIEDSDALVMEKAVGKKVLLVPGTSFMPQQGTKTPYVRASFSTASPEQIDEALQRLAALVREAK